MNTSTRRLSLLAALMAVGIVGAGCGDDSSHPQSQGRIVHGSPDAPPVAVYADVGTSETGRYGKAPAHT